MLANPPRVEFLRTIFKFRKRIKFRRRLFTSSLNSKIRQFHVVVVQKRQRNVQKKWDAPAKLLSFLISLLLFLTSSLLSCRRIVKSLAPSNTQKKPLASQPLARALAVYWTARARASGWDARGFFLVLLGASDLPLELEFRYICTYEFNMRWMYPQTDTTQSDCVFQH